MIISAKSANKLRNHHEVQKQWDDFAWNRLFTEILGAATQGKNYLTFYETEFSYFHEKRREVKERLENLGYNVTYKRFLLDSPTQVGENNNKVYRNKYFINW